MSQIRPLTTCVAILVTTAVAAAGGAEASAPDDPVWEIVDVTPIDVDGAPVTLSPDGAWLAGTRDDEVCVWNVGELTDTCSGAVPGVAPESITWSPDSSAVAFSNRAYELLIDSDIHVLDVESGEVTNLTDDGIEGQLPIGDADPAAPPAPVDVMPTWTPDAATIVFSRYVWRADDGGDASTAIMTVPRGGGEPATLGTIDQPAAIYSPMHVSHDGAVIYTVIAPDVADETNGIWQLDTDGSTTMLIPGDDAAPFARPVITSVREHDGDDVITGYSALGAAARWATEPIAFRWAPGEGVMPLPLEAVATDRRASVRAGVLSPDGGTVLQVTLIPGAAPAVELAGDSEASRPLPEPAGDAPPPLRHPVPTWSDNGTALIPSLGSSGPVLVTLSRQ